MSINDLVRSAEAGHIKEIQGYVAELDGFLQKRGALKPGESVENAENDRFDALRHAYVMGRLTLVSGPHVAYEIGRLHEENNPNSAGERRMDLHNNAMGIRYGAQIRDGYGFDIYNGGYVKDDPFLAKFPTKEEKLFALIHLALAEGKLITDPEQSKPYRGDLLSTADRDRVDFTRQTAPIANTIKSMDGTPALNGLKADHEDLAAALLKSAAERRFDLSKPLAVVPGRSPGEVFAIQGDIGDPTNVVAKVNVRDIEPGSAARNIGELNARADDREPTDGLRVQMTKGIG